MIWNYEPQTSRYGSKMLPPLKQITIFFCGWLGFRLFAYFLELLIIIFGGSNSKEILSSLNTSMLINSSAYLVLLVAIVLICNVDILKILRSFKRLPPYLMGIVCLITIYAFNFVYGLFLSILPLETGDNANEATLGLLSQAYPIASYLIFGIIGPICEEFTYRVGLFSYFRRKSKAVAYIVTAIVFSLIHFNFSLNGAVLLNEVLNLPFYIFAALAFSFVFDKFGLAGSLTAHILNNILSLSLISVIR